MKTNYFLSLKIIHLGMFFKLSHEGPDITQRLAWNEPLQQMTYHTVGSPRPMKLEIHLFSLPIGGLNKGEN